MCTVQKVTKRFLVLIDSINKLPDNLFYEIEKPTKRGYSFKFNYNCRYSEVKFTIKFVFDRYNFSFVWEEEEIKFSSESCDKEKFKILFEKVRNLYYLNHTEKVDYIIEELLKGKFIKREEGSVGFGEGDLLSSEKEEEGDLLS